MRDYARLDKRVGELINTLTPAEIIAEVYRRVGDCSIDVHGRYEAGEVREDTRGEGVLQYPARAEARAKLKGWDVREAR